MDSKNNTDSKEIRMPYSEYLSMVELTDRLLKELEILTRKDGNFPIIDFLPILSIKVSQKRYLGYIQQIMKPWKAFLVN